MKSKLPFDWSGTHDTHTFDYHICRSYRSRSELFMDVVSKRDYPLYYTMIKTPISMNMIKKRLNSTYYRTIAHFRDDFHLMFNNARIFNEEGSFVYEDANEMQVSHLVNILPSTFTNMYKRIYLMLNWKNCVRVAY